MVSRPIFHKFPKVLVAYPLLPPDNVHLGVRTYDSFARALVLREKGEYRKTENGFVAIGLRATPGVCGRTTRILRAAGAVKNIVM